MNTVPLDENVCRVKKKRRYTILDVSAPFRANVAHQFRKFCQTNSKQHTMWFRNNFLPSVCASSGTNDVPSQRCLDRWIVDYDDGCYDDILAVYKLQRIMVQTQIDRDDRKRMNACVLVRLSSLGSEEFANCSSAKCLEMLKSSQDEAGVAPYTRSKFWAYWIKEKARSKRRGNGKKNKGKKKVRIVAAVVMDVFSCDWNGAVPDAEVLEPTGMVSQEIVGENANHPRATIVRHDISANEYAAKIKRGTKMREILDGWCYLDADLDESHSSVFDLVTERKSGYDSINFTFEDGQPSVVVSSLPKESADRLSYLITKLYTVSDDGIGLGLQEKDLTNAHQMRGKPPRGFMTSFGLFAIVNGGLASVYANTRTNVVNEECALFEILGEMEAIIYAWLEENHPDVLQQLNDDNNNYYGNYPPYAKDGKFVSPRVVISWQLANEPHKDPNDNGLSVVFWIVGSDDLGKVNKDNWRFVFQNLSTGTGKDRRDTTTIPLFHGIVIIYDGKRIRHATTISLTNTVNKFGVFHGSTNPQGYKKNNPGKK